MSIPRHNLPLPADEHIGRERDTADLSEIVRSSRMVSLTGAGGIGKTRLAMRVAEALAADFDHGVCFVDITKLDGAPSAPSTAQGPGLSAAASADQAAGLIAHTLGVSELHEGTAAEALAMVLAPRGLLLVLDTCELVTPGIGDLCTELLAACPRLHILTTGTGPVHAERELVWRVPPLSLPPSPDVLQVRETWEAEPAPAAEEALRHEAPRLFLARARAVRPGFALTSDNTEAVLQICRMLEGLPLAIELAAARIRVLSAQQVLERLDDRFRLLAGSDVSLPPRQRTMRAALEWSHGFLDPSQRVLLRRLAAFCTWVPDLVASSCGFGALDAEHVDAAHTALLDKSLIAREYGFTAGVLYRMTETVHRFGEEKLAEAGEEDEIYSRALICAAGWMEGLGARLSGPVPWEERLGVIQMLDGCLENTLNALDRAVPLGRVEEALRISVALRFHWLMRELHPQILTRLDALLASSSGATPLRARAMAVRAELLLSTERADSAEDAAAAAVSAGETCEDPPARAIAHTVLARAALRRGAGGDALAHGRTALRLADESGERFTEVAALEALARAAQSRGDHESSTVYLQRGIAAGQSVGDRWSAARCMYALGLIATRLDDLADAERRLDGALEVFTELDLGTGVARCTAGLGHLDLARGDVSGARRRLSRSLRLGVASGRRTTVAQALEALAGLAMAEEQPERAVALAGAGAALRASSGTAAPDAMSVLAEARALLPDDVADRAWNDWRVLPMEQLVDRALHFTTPRRPLPSLLTRREKEISVLVAKGLSNREIADHLTISQATAARHIANIFRKLLFTSRTQLAAWARHHDLEP